MPEDQTDTAAAFVHRGEVGWGDCDPARIAYTARIPDMAIRAIEGWWRHHHADWLEMHESGLGTPFVSMSLDFRAPVRPGDLLCEVRPVQLGGRTVVFEVTARQEERVRFEGRFTCIFVDPERMAARDPGETVRAAIEAQLPPRQG